MNGGVLGMFRQMMRLPWAVALFTLEQMSGAMERVDRATEEGWGRLAARLEGVPSSPAEVGGLEREAPEGADRRRMTEPSRSAARVGRGQEIDDSTGAASAGAANHGKEGRTVADTNLSDDMVKLVRYSVVSVKRDLAPAKAILVSGREKLFDDNLDGEAFATWVTSEVAAAEGMSEADRKYLRVSYEVLQRWPKQDREYERRQLEILEGIRDRL